MLTALASLIYLNYGILYPFYACILFAGIAGGFILVFWKENDMQRLKDYKNVGSIDQ
jgi:hypothetical protein